MAHFMEEYLDRVLVVLHAVLSPTWFYKQEVLVVPELVTGLFITYDGVRDDSRTIRECSWDDFHSRLAAVSPDWTRDTEFLKNAEAKNPKFGIAGWERRTMYMFRAGNHPEHWTPSDAVTDFTALLMSSAVGSAHAIQAETEHLRDIIPAGAEHFAAFEHIVRVVLNFLFVVQLGEGKSQSRTEPEDEGVEIRDLIFANEAESGFWSDLKYKYSVSEVVVDAKNKDALTRDDLRQLYCYLKPALGFWGFIVCRSEQSALVNAFNRTLFRNFNQERGVLILNDADMRRMVQIKLAGQDPGAYLQKLMSDFARSI